MFSCFYESDESKPAAPEPEATVDVMSAPADPAPAAHHKKHHKHHHHKHRHKSKDAANPASGNAADVESAALAPDADASRPVLLSKQSVRLEILEEMKEERLAARRRANELDETVRSWGFDPRTNLGTAAKSLLKTTDQATPMMMRKYTRQRGFCLSLLIMFCMAAAFAGGFIFVARQLVKCTKDNECKTCALSVVDLEKAAEPDNLLWASSESENKNIKCSQLSQPSLTINAGCLSIAIDGKDGRGTRVDAASAASQVPPLAGTINFPRSSSTAGSTPSRMRASPTSTPAISPRARPPSTPSLSRTRRTWTFGSTASRKKRTSAARRPTAGLAEPDAVALLRYGQLVDPVTAPRVRRGQRGASTPAPPQDVSCVQKWSRKNWAGYADRYDLLSHSYSYTYDDPQDDDLNEQWIAYAIKVIYGGISTTCALYTSQLPENTLPSFPRKILKADITYLELAFCACKVKCPGDGVLATTAIEASDEGSEGLGEARPGAGVPRPARGDARIPGRARDSRPLHRTVPGRVRRSVLWP